MSNREAFRSDRAVWLKATLALAGAGLYACAASTASPAASATSPDPPRQTQNDDAKDPERIARRHFEAAWRGDREAVRADLASYDDIVALTKGELTRAQYDEAVEGYLKDLVADPPAPARSRVSGVKVVLKKHFAKGENEKLRRAADIVVVRPILSDGTHEQEASSDFTMFATPSGWRFAPHQ